MGDIFAGAEIVLIAADAPTAHAGFLRERPGADIIFGTLSVGKLIDYYQPEGPPGRLPIDRRAWTFQEWVLARRSLIFSTTSYLGNAGAAARPADANQLLGSSIRREILRVTVSSGGNNVFCSDQGWCGCLKWYTGRKLSDAYLPIVCPPQPVLPGRWSARIMDNIEKASNSQA
jgi:hypothetical protein